jgi:hypothetical protein
MVIDSELGFVASHAVQPGARAHHELSSHYICMAVPIAQQQTTKGIVSIAPSILLLIDGQLKMERVLSMLVLPSMKEIVKETCPAFSGCIAFFIVQSDLGMWRN